jgi:chromosome segregation ATPase
MDVLQRRIEAQRFELIQQKEGIQSALTRDVASLQERCEQDHISIITVHTRYRDLLDQNSRLSGDLAEANSALQEHAFALVEFESCVHIAESAVSSALITARLHAEQLARWHDSVQRQEEEARQSDAVKTRLQSALAELAALRADSAALTSRLDERDAHLDALQRSLAAAKAELSQRAAEKEQGRLELEGLQARVAAQDREMGEQARLLEQAEMAHGARRTELDLARSAVAAAAERAAELDRELAAAREEDRERAARAEADLREQKEALAALAAERDRAARAAADARATAAEAEAEAERLREGLFAAQAQAGALAGRAELLRGELDLLRGEQDRLQAALVAAAEQLAAQRLAAQQAGAEAAGGGGGDAAVGKGGSGAGGVLRAEETRTVESTRTVTRREDVATTAERCRTEHRLPDGGEVAAGVGITVKYQSRETTLAMETKVAPLRR